MSRQGYELDRRTQRVADALGNLVAVEAGQAHVDHRHVRPEPERLRDGGGAVCRLAHAVAGVLQEVPHHLARVLMILDDEDMKPSDRSRGRGLVGAGE